MIMILFKNIVVIKNMANIKWAENMADNVFIQNIIFIKNMTNIRWTREHTCLTSSTQI